MALKTGDYINGSYLTDNSPQGYVICTVNNQILLNADVSSYYPQSTPRDLYLIIVVLIFGWIIGLITRELSYPQVINTEEVESSHLK